MYTKRFEEISKADVAVAGGKGASLGEMTAAGIPVPPGFVVVADAVESFLSTADLTQEIEAALDSVDHNAMHTVEAASEGIQHLILEAEMPPAIAEKIVAAHKKLGAEFVAVRSSATVEDSASAAWAGQLDSFLNVREEGVVEHVQKCWASLFTPRAIFYRFEQGLHRQQISVAVVVQKMVNAEVSGIAFSVHPVTEDRNQMIIEAGFGLGEAIVQGMITPDSYVLEKEPRALLDVNVNMQRKGLFRKDEKERKERKVPVSNSIELDTDGYNEWRNLSEDEGGRQVLTGQEIIELADIVLRIEKHYGFPVDVEWVREKGKFYIVQSRPITTLKK